MITLAFAVLVVACYLSGLAGYKIGKRDAFEEGLEWPAGRGDQDDVRLDLPGPDLDTIPLAAVPVPDRRPLSHIVRVHPGIPGPGHVTLPAPGEKRAIPERTTDFIAKITEETSAYIQAMNR